VRQGTSFPYAPQAVASGGRPLAECALVLYTSQISTGPEARKVIVTGDGHLKIITSDGPDQGRRRLTWRHLIEALGTPEYMARAIQGERGDPAATLLWES